MSDLVIVKYGRNGSERLDFKTELVKYIKSEATDQDILNQTNIDAEG